MDRLPEHRFDGVAQQTRTFAGIAALIADRMSLIETMRTVAGEAHPEITRNGDDRDLFGRRFEAHEENRVREILSVCRGGSRRRRR